MSWHPEHKVFEELAKDLVQYGHCFKPHHTSDYTCGRERIDLYLDATTYCQRCGRTLETLKEHRQLHLDKPKIVDAYSAFITKVEEIRDDDIKCVHPYDRRKRKEPSSKQIVLEALAEMEKLLKTLAKHAS